MRRARVIGAGVAAILAGLVLGGCSLSGRPVSRERSLASFDAIQVGGGVDHVDVRIGARGRAVVRAGNKVIDAVKTEVRDGTLRISAHRKGIVIGSDGLDDVHVQVSAPTLRRLDAGGGETRIAGLREGAFAITATHAATVSATGSVDDLRAHVANAADADLSGLAARRATVSVTNAASASLDVSEVLDVSVTNAADVSYRGNPRVESSVRNAGDLKHSP